MSNKRLKQPLRRSRGLRQWPSFLHRAILKPREAKKAAAQKELEAAVEQTIKDLDKESKKR